MKIGGQALTARAALVRAARCVAITAVVFLAFAGAAGARPFDIDDLLASESFGRAAIDPTGRWLVFEQRAPYASGTRFDANTATRLGLSRVWRVDLAAASPAPVLLAPEAGPGVLLAGFSPGGSHLALNRLQDGAWTMGVATPANGAVRWWPLTPQEAGEGRAWQWRTETTLLVIARTDGLPPLTIREGSALATRLPAQWAAAARGDPAVSVLGSGRYRDVRTRAPDNQLLAIDVLTGEQRVLATGAFTDLELSPDGRRVALLALGPDLQARPDGPARGVRGFETEARRLAILDLQTGALRTPCPTCDVLPQLLSWSPSGRRLLAFDRGPDGLWSTGRFWTLDAATGETRVLDPTVRPHLDLNPARIWTDWMGETPLVFGRHDGATRDDWYALSDRGARNLTQAIPARPDPRVRIGAATGLVVLADGRVWRLDATSRLLGPPTGPFQASGVDQGGARLNRAPASALTLRAGPSSSPTGWATLTAKELVDQGLASGDGLVRARGSTAVVDEVVDAQGVSRLRLWRAGRPVQNLATINTQLAETDAMLVQPILTRDGAGRVTTSWLYRPPSKGPWPLVVRPYLGAAPTIAPGTGPEEPSVMLNLRALTGHGYAVLAPGLPAPVGGLTEPAAGVGAAILRAVDAALTDPTAGPHLDPGRLAIAGYSFGGFTTLAALTQTDRFRAGISISGLSDFTALWSSLPPSSTLFPENGYASLWPTGGVESTQPRLERPPWAAADRYVRNSPIYAADRITTPVMLMHGALDQIPIAQSQALYSALFRQNKDALLVTYFGALHTLTSPGDIRDAYRRIFDFLDAHLAAPASVSSNGRAVHPEPGSASAAPRPPPRSPPPGRRRPAPG